MKTKALTRAEKEARGMTKPAQSNYETRREKKFATLADALSPEVRERLEAMANG